MSAAFLKELGLDPEKIEGQKEDKINIDFKMCLCVHVCICTYISPLIPTAAPSMEEDFLSFIDLILCIEILWNKHNLPLQYWAKPYKKNKA